MLARRTLMGLISGRCTLIAVLIVALTGCGQNEVPSGSSHQSTEPAATPTVARGAIAFVDGYRRGYEVAQREGRPMLVFFTASWCQYCHQMADEAFTQAPVVNLSRQFLCVLVDADLEPDVCQHFQIRGYPTIQFLAPNGAPLHRVVGKRPGHQLVIDMQTALQAVARIDAQNRVVR